MVVTVKKAEDLRFCQMFYAFKYWLFYVFFCSRMKEIF